MIDKLREICLQRMFLYVQMRNCGCGIQITGWSVQGSVEANDAFKILQRRVEGGITFKQFEAEYAAFFIRFVLLIHECT